MTELTDQQLSDLLAKQKFLTEEEIVEIQNLADSGVSTDEIARRLGKLESTVTESLKDQKKS